MSTTKYSGITNTSHHSQLTNYDGKYSDIPNLGTGPANPAKAVFKANGDRRMTLGRKAFAIWLLAEMKAEKWVGNAPILLNA
jgi:hypothetical protein